MATAFGDQLDHRDHAAPGLIAFAGNFAQAASVERYAGAAGYALHGLIYIDAFDVVGPSLDDAAVCLVLADERADPDRLAELLCTLDKRADRGGPAIVAQVPMALLDLAAACLSARASTLLAEPDPAELVASLAVAAPRTRAADQVADPNGDRKRAELRRLSEDVERIARVLAALSNEQAAASPPAASAGARDAEPLTHAAMLALVQALLRARRLRERFFAADLFSDPAWDMLLDLMAARLERKQVGVSSLCIAAAVPPTTALRQLKAMTDAGLFVRRPDPADARRVYIELADSTAAAMTRYLASLRNLLAPV